MKLPAKFWPVAFALAATLTGSAVAGFKAIADTAAPTTASPVASVIQLKASVNPNPPRAGDNTLDLQLSEASGQPVIGLKLSIRVEMTSMDMGTTHPFVKDMGKGHYRATVTFSMAGPWRVTMSTGHSKAVLNFDADGKSAWKPPLLTLSTPVTGASAMPPTSSGSSTALMNGMPGMDMPAPSPVNNTSPPPVQAAGATGPGFGPNGPPTGAASGSMAGMDMPGSNMSGMKMSGNTDAAMEMKPLKMPQLQEQGTYIATGHENWKVRTGFGKNTGMVGMMSQMMVGGSGMEGMKMPSMKMDFSEANFTPDTNDEDAGPPTRL